MSSSREHAYTTRRDENTGAGPSHAERARTLLHLCREGMLSTHSLKCPGFPFGSLMPFALDAKGYPLFLISRMAMHTQNLVADPRASLFVAQDSRDGDSLGASRVTLVGNAMPVPDELLAGNREAYLNRHPNARYWVDFKDFDFYQLDAVDVYFVGGFGVMGWVDAPDLTKAAPDPLADSAVGIIGHMNADHTEALLVLARAIKGIQAEEAEMTAVDRLGFHMRLKTAEGMRSVRVGFSKEVRSSEACRAALMAMVVEAKKSTQD